MLADANNSHSSHSSKVGWLRFHDSVSDGWTSQIDGEKESGRRSHVCELRVLDLSSHKVLSLTAITGIHKSPVTATC